MQVSCQFLLLRKFRFQIKAEEEEEELEKEDDHDVDEFTSSSVIENFDDLVRKCKTIEFPDTRWTFATIGKNILITYWNSSFNCLKKIIIKHNLKMTVIAIFFIFIVK